MGPVHRYLVTAPLAERMDLWAFTATYANWIEGRHARHNPPERETWIVTCFDDHAQAFLGHARDFGVTVEEIHGAAETETYELLVGEPGTGWAKAIRR